MDGRQEMLLTINNILLTGGMKDNVRFSFLLYGFKVQYLSHGEVFDNEELMDFIAQLK